jgi:trans-aconitate methyltransferase
LSKQADEAEWRAWYGDGPFSHAADEERRRLALAEEEQDPQTRTLLEALGLERAWHCLEVGAGAGSMAWWLAERCSDGRVVATDLDTSLLDRAAPPNLEVLRHDVTRDSFPAESFDLVHARSVLAHIGDRPALLRRMRDWLRPGGWLLLEEPASFPLHSSPHRGLRRAAEATAAMVRAMGADPDWSRSLPRPLAEAGLVDVDADCRLRLMRGGSREAVLLDLVLQQVASGLTATGLIDPEELGVVRAQLADPEFYDFPPAMVRAWGRRPEPAP